MENGIEPNGKKDLGRRARDFTRFLLSVNPEEPRNPEDKFERREALDNSTGRRLTKILNKVLEKDGHVIVLRSLAGDQSGEFSNDTYLAGKTLLTKVELRAPDYYLKRVEQHRGKVSLSVHPHPQITSETTVEFRVGDKVIFSFSSPPSPSFDIGVHFGMFIYPVLVKKITESGNVWFLNQRAFEQAHWD